MNSEIERHSSNDGKEYAKRVPKVEDACKICINISKRKRRYSTSEPSVRKCNLGCGYYVYEIHFSCLDCAEKFNVCSWCDNKIINYL